MRCVECDDHFHPNTFARSGIGSEDDGPTTKKGEESESHFPVTVAIAGLAIGAIFRPKALLVAEKPLSPPAVPAQNCELSRAIEEFQAPPPYRRGA